MRHTLRFTLALLACLWTGLAFAQGPKGAPFSNCTAAFLGAQIIVDEYSPRGKCVLPKSAKGELTVNAVYLKFDSTTMLEPLRFMVAIRHSDTGTLVMYSSQVYTELPVEQVLTQCRPTDSIVLLTLDNLYSLPHNEILVQE